MGFPKFNIQNSSVVSVVSVVNENFSLVQIFR